MAVSTSPRIELEFENCQREDWLDWNIKAAQSELQACGKYPDEAVALKVVDEESGDVAGYAVWGWSERVRIPRIYVILLPSSEFIVVWFCTFLETEMGGKVKMKEHLSQPDIPDQPESHI